MTDSVECVQVVVRCRPLNQKEIDRKCQTVVAVHEDSGEVVIGNADAANPNPSSQHNDASFYSSNKKQSSSLPFPSKRFTFDKAFGENSNQESIYEQTARSIVHSALDGYNGTIFAYGQTGTGKTYTMVGFNDDGSKQGIIPRAFRHIFDAIHSDTDNCNNFLVRCSFIEIYNDMIKDLLNADERSLELREHPEKGVYVKDLSYKQVNNEQQLQQHFAIGNNYRHVGETAMNRDSSRSHSVFTIIIESVIQENIRVGKLHLVDLAGSERQSKTEAKGVRFTEAININLSLSALGNVINALTSSSSSKSKHIPYRDSKLTRILQDSLGGNSKTVMIANICSSDYNLDETLSTLRFANRAKSIKNKPHINQDPKDKLLEQYKQQIEELKQRLANKQKNGELMDEDDGMEEEIMPEIIIQKVHKIGISKERVRRMYELQQKEEERLKEKFEREREEWRKQTKGYLTQKIQTEKKLKYLEQEVLIKKQLKKENIKQKLLDIEQKLVDGEKMMNSAAKQEMELLSKQQLLSQIKAKEAELRENYLQKHQKHLLLKEKYDSHEQELKDKKNKLKKLYEKYKQLSSNIENLQSSFQSKREEYLNIVRILNKKIQLKNTIIEYFIDPNQLQKLYQSKRIVLEENPDDEEIDKLYTIKKVDLQHLSNTVKRPISCKQQRITTSTSHSKEQLPMKRRIKPVTEWNRIQCVLLQNENPRYRYDNIIQLNLDMPQRTTQDYYPLYE
eukprot:CAMPEP_0197075110 /NCGR_PEP_ID=MMETSP1384-20130603/211443_1 /TAXON_ID=29189 /ORGANISM="Ammonia sp." /LENGTH=733 /DNA_ID=CAMNT_0042513953 /DNA_START=18 /DNA_END=2219 /DNA_ORIENTATION=-